MHVAQTLFLGDNLLPLMLLAFGGALVAGNTMALIKPPQGEKDEGDLERPPLVRTLVFILVGSVMTIWALATLIAS